ncbi:MAG: gamma-glutamyltransferase [Rhodospirillales bacterium]|nr:gamma-glutamyltransferase [Rhodospirillales bacterium]MDE0378917.1 gamma-glutamyltransferase [Rhodospirillales bacterium]
MSKRQNEYATFDPEAIDALRPVIRGHRHGIVAGHYLAAQAGFAILEGGGNAIDAGVAAGIALGVVHSDLVNVGGVAPIILYSAKTGQVETISGLGTWPSAVTPDLFQREHDGNIPVGLLRTVVPSAPDAWITALERHGTMTFGEVAAGAIRLASAGFVMYPLMASVIAKKAENYARWPSNAAIYLPGGSPPAVGDVFGQADLGRSLQYMADEERAAGGDRAAGLAAARDAFYRGDIAAAIATYHGENGGLLTADDLASFRVAVEPPERVSVDGVDVYACGAWCQGPTLLQALRLIDMKALAAMGHNSADALHTMAEALKLAFADRERWIGDPRFVDVPMAALLSDDYAERRRALIRPGEAWPALPPAGDPAEGLATTACTEGAASTAPLEAAHDTSYVCTIDAEGNVFSATPSDVSFDTPVIPGTGLCASSRGAQSWADPAHTSSVAPGKRPRLTPNPALAIKEGAFVMPFGTPGGDVQIQAMLQTFVNIVAYGMNPQAAVEAPRFATMSFPNSFEPHEYHPGKLMLEARIPEATGETLAAWGHGVEWWPEWAWPAGAMCVLVQDLARGTISGGADPRRPAYGLAW